MDNFKNFLSESLIVNESNAFDSSKVDLLSLSKFMSEILQLKLTIKAGTSPGRLESNDFIAQLPFPMKYLFKKIIISAYFIEAKHETAFIKKHGNFYIGNWDFQYEHPGGGSNGFGLGGMLVKTIEQSQFDKAKMASTNYKLDKSLQFGFWSHSGV